jgi:beta-mannosidase
MTENAAQHRSVRFLHEGWQLARTAPGACTDPARLDALRPQWRAALVPGTVGSSLQTDLRTPGPYDRDDWWYRLRFALPERKPGARYRLRFAGLATLAQVWLNGEPVASSRNMYVPCEADVTERLHDENELAIRFASLEAACAQKRPRGRWKSALVARQDLRWFRTTLLGRMPGWTPEIDPVGPWGPVSLECEEGVHIERVRMLADVVEGVPRLCVELDATPLDAAIDAARVRIDDRAFPLAIEGGESVRVRGELAIPGAPLWWPHTHGKPRRAACAIELRVRGEWRTVDCARVGFRHLELDSSEGCIEFRVNGTRVFCRGACWTPLDFLALRASREELRAALVQLRDAGANMLRVGGTMAYESDEFYELCDELGILVWQDFMFANLDYPARDAQFVSEVEGEARALLARLHRHAWPTFRRRRGAGRCRSIRRAASRTTTAWAPIAGRSPMRDSRR